MRVREEYAGNPVNLEDLTRQDSIVLNLQRVAQAAIDLAMYLVRIEGLGLPQQSRDAFSLLAERGGLPHDLATALMRMVGFRNVAVHAYQTLNLDVVRAVVEHRLGDFEAFVAWALSRNR